jgi:dTDP-4-amino-4,6-dideoxygalactose transaminase
MIRLNVPVLEEDDFRAVREVLETGFLVQGARVAAFEKAFAERVSVPHAVAVTNCTAALHLSMQALDVRAGDIVLVPAFSWLSTANVVELCGAQPVFVDIEPHSFNMAPAALEETLTRLHKSADVARRIRAVLPVHAFGRVADLGKISQIAERFGHPVVEDAACALGARHENKEAGSMGLMGCFSFHPRKAITTGEGGVITTHDARIAKHLRALRNHGLDPESATPDFIMPGHNTRMTEFQAALGVTQLSKLDRLLATRRALAANYNKSFAGSAVTPPPQVPEGDAHAYQSYVTLLPKEAAPRRADIIKKLREQNIETTIGTYHMPMTTYFRAKYGHVAGDFPVTDDLFARALTLPLHDKLDATAQATVVAGVLEVVKNG